jgi:hypothetical protein
VAQQGGTIFGAFRTMKELNLRRQTKLRRKYKSFEGRIKRKINKKYGIVYQTSLPYPHRQSMWKKLEFKLFERRFFLVLRSSHKLEALPQLYIRFSPSRYVSYRKLATNKCGACELIFQHANGNVIN